MSQYTSDTILSSDEPLLDVVQAAEFLRVSPGTIRRWAQKKQLTGVKVGVRGDWRFTRESLMGAVQSNGGATGPRNKPGGGSSVSIQRSCTHKVQFYEDDDFLIQKLREYVLEAFAADGVCVLVATHDHLAALHDALRKDFDMEAAKRDGRIAVYDAATTLRRFVGDAGLNYESFETVAGGIINRAGMSGRPVYMFGEMVALLWRHGEDDLSVELEDAWDLLVTKHKFQLLSAYPMEAFSESAYSMLFNELSSEGDRASIEGRFLRENIDTDLLASGATEDTESNAPEGIDLASYSQGDEFISVASHELRTPATGVKQYLSMLLEGYLGELTPEQRRTAEKAYESNERQLKIADNLMLITRINAGKITIDATPNSMNDIVLSVIQERQPELACKDQAVVVDMMPNLMARFDPLYMRLVIDNLVSNASQYSGVGAKIYITGSLTDGRLTVAIRDEGVGIEPENMDKIYQKFSRIYGQWSVRSGGLGLYWSRKIMGLHDGELAVESRPGHGSTFTVSLPSHRAIGVVGQ